MLDQKLKESTPGKNHSQIEMDINKALIEEEKYCVDLITQSRSIQLSLKSMDRVLLANHLRGQCQTHA